MFLYNNSTIRLKEWKKVNVLLYIKIEWFDQLN